MAFLLYQGYQVVLKSPLFRLEEIVVQGNQSLSEEKIVSLVGVKTGRGLFEVNLGEVEARLLSNPLIREARISRRLPSGLLISIEERKPVAWINAGSLYGIDREGVLLPPFEPMVMPDLPIITGLKVEGTSFGARLDSDGLDLALEFLDWITQAIPGLVDQISEVDVSNPRNIRLYTIRGEQVQVGETVDLEKMVSLAAVLEDLKGKGIMAEYIDLRFGDQVIVKPRR